MKALLLSLLISTACYSSAFAQRRHSDLSAYKKIPDSFRKREDLVKYIVPDKEYTYWEFDFGLGDTTRSAIIFSSGTKSNDIAIKDRGGSLFAGCQPLFCYYYIAYVYDGKVGYINNNQDFIKFIGRIDNIQEAILLAGIVEDIYPDYKKIGSAYRITPTGFQLILTKWNLCPEYKQAIQIDVSPNGITKKKKRKIYYKPGGCGIA